MSWQETANLGFLPGPPHIVGLFRERKRDIFLILLHPKFLPSPHSQMQCLSSFKRITLNSAAYLLPETFRVLHSWHTRQNRLYSDPKKGILIICCHLTDHRISDRAAQSTELDELKKSPFRSVFPKMTKHRMRNPAYETPNWL
jgi:hypothetical protein